MTTRREFWAEHNPDGSVAVCCEVDTGLGAESRSVATFFDMPDKKGDVAATAETQASNYIVWIIQDS